MIRTMMAAAALLAAMPVAAAETPAAPPALVEAMKYFYVVVPADVNTGNLATETRRDADGTNQRHVVIAYIDAEDAKTETVEAGLAERTEGRLVNGADLWAATRGDVIWRTKAANAAISNTSRGEPPAFYITQGDGSMVTQEFDGEFKVVFYLDAEEADRVKTEMTDFLATQGQSAALNVVVADFSKVIGAILDGRLQAVRIASSPSVVRWSMQREAGAVLIRDYKGEMDEAFDALATFVFE
ncbi:hypothetical protein [Hyphomonas sp.]|jgi:predicted transcriptional regulator|uniref:hypothetical protein n=1 Tax=Hyphomonas sp. TaxID=87 RepID=UPI00391D7EBE